MKKLLLLVFSLTLVLVFTSNTFAQQGLVKVASNTELIQALNDPSVESIEITQDGFYDEIMMDAVSGTVITKNGDGSRSCTFSITRTNKCFVSDTDKNYATAGLTGTDCPPQPTSGAYGWSSPTAGLTFVLTDMADIYDYDAVFTTTAPGDYLVIYKWNAFDAAQANVFLFSTPVITVLTSADDSVCGLTVDVTFDYDMGALPSDTTVTWYVDGSPVTGYPTMPGIFTFTAPNCGDVELKLEVGNTQCGADDEILDLYFFSTPVVDAGDDDFACGFVYEGLNGSASVGCGTIDSETWTAAAGNPGNATFNSDTVTVDACGAYSFVYTATSGDCSATDTVLITFVDTPIAEAGDDTSSCGVILPPPVMFAGEFRGYGTLRGSYVAACEADEINVNWSVWSGPAGASVTYVDENDTLVTDIVVNMCGTYKFLLQVTNGPVGSNCYDTDTVTFKFYDPPEVDAGPDASVCGLTTYFTPMDTVECDNGDEVTRAWSLAPGAPGTATFDGDTVLVTDCGVYEFVLEVTNTLCVETDTVVVEFFDIPDVNAGEDEDICGIYVNPGEFLGLAKLKGGYAASCTGGNFLTSEWTYTYDGPFVTGNVDYLSGADADTTEIEVDSCGIYTFMLEAYSIDDAGDTICTGSDESIFKFYDMPDIDAGVEDTAICGYDLAFTPTWSVVCDNGDPVTTGWVTIGAPTGGTATFFGDSVSVDTCGIYELVYVVTNTTCTAKDTVTVEFFNMPTDVDAGENDTVCGYTADLLGSYVSTCGVADVKWAKVSGPGWVMFDPEDENNTTVTVDTCGTYIFKFEVTNGLCIDSAYVTIDFIGTATFVYDDAYPIPDSVCGYETDPFYLGYFITCSLDDAEGAWTTQAGASIDTAHTRADYGGANWIAEADECGEYWYKYTVSNGDCTVDTTILISFFESPDPVIPGPDTVYTCSTVEYCATVADTCNVLLLTDYTFTWTVAGGEFLGNGETTITATCVDVVWDEFPYMPARGTTAPMLTLHASINGVDGCEGYDTMYVYKQLPTLEGQVKYWNAPETYMPSPYATDDYQTIPFDYFYVTLYLDDMQALIPLDTAFVQARLTEDLFELMSYFDFELNTELYGCDAKYIMKVWDGGMLYHTTPPAPLEETKLGGSTYTYNNWGGVNATDALAIQLMVGAANQINGAPWNYNWVGLTSYSPWYGYYSHKIADVNSSDKYVNGGVTALDALTAKYRTVGLLGSYPDNSGNNQFSPNFRVTGRMVDILPEITFPMPFDSTNVIDVPFDHSGTDYMYFSLAIDHQYTSAPIPWEGAANFINIYYESIGDINASYTPPGSGLKAEPTETLTYEGMFAANVDDVVTIPINIDRDVEVGAITLSFNYRNDLIEVLGTNFADDDMFINQEEGSLNMAWFSTESVDYVADAAVALIKIRILDEIPADVELFELNVNTELADATANPIDVDLKTKGVSTDKGLVDGAALTASNYPNPFNDATTISYSLPEMGKVKIDVYNNMGMKVATLVDETQESGLREIVFNTGDVNPGVYFYHITLQGETKDYSAVKRMIVVN